MPTYEYQCKKCGNHFDIEQRMTDDAITTHDECGGDVVRVFSTAGIVLKGSGFYKTDARTKSESTTASKKDSGTTEKSSGSTSEKPSTSPKSDSSASPSTPKTAAP